MDRCPANTRTQQPGNSGTPSRQPIKRRLCHADTHVANLAKKLGGSRCARYKSTCDRGVVSHQSRRPTIQSTRLCVFAPWRLCVETRSAPTRPPTLPATYLFSIFRPPEVVSCAARRLALSRQVVSCNFRSFRIGLPIGNLQFPLALSHSAKSSKTLPAPSASRWRKLPISSIKWYTYVRLPLNCPADIRLPTLPNRKLS
jgi:hypothetical protein